ncbi:MAG TPA: 50S ribosomal protein L9 [Firmicutes bacterium]|jgi:large subunit ribosomal protein L9|nr:50S ribosomal protein L9 [Bacillota bacterium]
MRIILLEDVKKLGQKGEVVNVADGYARNFLIPRNLAVEANASNMRKLEHIQAVIQDKARKEEREARELAERLAGVTVVVKAKIGENERLFGSITAQDIVDALDKMGFAGIDKRRIEMEEPIKTLGEYAIPVKLYQGVTAQVAVKVIAE